MKNLEHAERPNFEVMSGEDLELFLNTQQKGECNKYIIQSRLNRKMAYIEGPCVYDLSVNVIAPYMEKKPKSGNVWDQMIMKIPNKSQVPEASPEGDHIRAWVKFDLRRSRKFCQNLVMLYPHGHVARTIGITPVALSRKDWLPCKGVRRFTARKSATGLLWTLTITQACAEKPPGCGVQG